MKTLLRGSIHGVKDPRTLVLPWCSTAICGFG
jgi:hypothetical protein